MSHSPGHRYRTVRATALALGLLLAACGDDGGSTAGNGGNDADQTTTTAPPDPALGDVDATLTEIGEFDEPLALVGRPDDDALFLAERAGQVLRLVPEGDGTDRTYTVQEEPVVDISDEVVTSFEQGLLGIAFSPDGERLYLSYSLGPDGHTRVISYNYREPPPGPATGQDGSGDGDSAPSGPGQVDEASRRQILAVDQPYDNHNGGHIVFGPDGYLYVGLGDGGDAGDPDGNGQDPGTLLGSILRIDPESTAGTGEPYAIPDDNPFAGGERGRPEVWLYGVRNPWRFSFDAVTGDLWVADVGQNAWEEVNLLPADEGAGKGANLGWNEMEGTHPFDGGTNPSGAVLPVFEYPRPDEGCASITGGYVYSGPDIPALDGVYLFGDYCVPGTRGLRVDGREVTGEATLAGLDVESLVSFGQDNDGRIYLLSQDGPVYRLDP